MLSVRFGCRLHFPCVCFDFRQIKNCLRHRLKRKYCAVVSRFFYGKQHLLFRQRALQRDYLLLIANCKWGAFYGKALHDKSCVIYPIIIDDSAPPALISQIKYLRFNDDEYTSELSTLLRSLRKQFSKWTSDLEYLSRLSLVYIPHYTLDFEGIMGYNSA